MGPYTASAVDMLDFFERQQEWSYETFGPPTFKGPKGPLDHLAKEVIEASAAWDRVVAAERLKVPPFPLEGDRIFKEELFKAREEIIDCLFLVFDAAHRAGMSYSEMSRIAMEKLAKNKLRTWPDWRGTDPDKAIEHDRSAEVQQ